MSWVTLDRICQERDDLGRIGPGAVADLLVLDGIRVAEHSARLVL
jgi:imidazolonepropionase-like amidohydrolase